MHIGHGLHDLLAGGVALLHENLVNLTTILFGNGCSFSQLFGADDAPPYQEFAQVCHS
jgi:hypothetical protein